MNAREEALDLILATMRELRAEVALAAGRTAGEVLEHLAAVQQRDRAQAEQIVELHFSPAWNAVDEAGAAILH